MITFKKIIARIGFCLISLSTVHASEDVSSPVIAITQIAPHPSLDAIRQGAEDTIRTKFPKAQILFENAQGNMAMAVQIATRLTSREPDVFIAITTPSTQAALKSTRSQKVPLVFAAVSDPGAINLPLVDYTGALVTGVADIPPLSEQIALIKKLTPDVKNVGYIYNPGEANSVAVLERLGEIVEKEGITLYPVTATTTAEVSTAATSLIGKVDAIFMSNDNTVASSLNSVLKVAGSEKIPVYASDPESVGRGCLAATAASQYEIGCQAGALVLRVLAGEPVDTLPVEAAKNVATTLNSTVAEELGINIPADLVATLTQGE